MTAVVATMVLIYTTACIDESAALVTAVARRVNVTEPPEVRATPAEVVTARVIVWPVVVARVFSLLVIENVRLVVDVVTYAVRAVGIVHTYRRSVAQSRVPTAAVQAPTVYDWAVPSSVKVCSAVVGAVALVSKVHSERIVRATVAVLLAIAVPVGVVPVTLNSCTPAMASVTEALVRVHVLVLATQASAALRAVGTVAA